jgi:hypothetical protein
MDKIFFEKEHILDLYNLPLPYNPMSSEHL